MAIRAERFSIFSPNPVEKEQDMTEWLIAKGETADRLRDFDWSSTPLGPLQSWPQSLRTSVNFMFAARQPVYVAWGNELWSMYNDSYLPIVGDKHPIAMG